jgi:hypothetical protein
MNISILFDGQINGETILMDKITQIRNNREIFKASTDLIFNQTGKIIIYENNQEKQMIEYSIGISDDEVKWYQLNGICDTYVFQVKLQNIDGQLKLLKIAVQKLLGKINRLLNI